MGLCPYPVIDQDHKVALNHQLLDESSKVNNLTVIAYWFIK